MSDEKNSASEIPNPATTEATSAGIPSENFLVTEHLQRMPSLVARGILYLVVLALLVGLVYSLLGTMDIVVSCPAVAKIDTEMVSGEKPVLRMDIIVGNKFIGIVEPGMEVRYKFDAFPYADFGALRGHIVSVSETAVHDDAMGFVFHARGVLAREYFQSQSKKYQIRPGMTATAEMITGKKTIFSILVGKKR